MSRFRLPSAPMQPHNWIITTTATAFLRWAHFYAECRRRFPLWWTLPWLHTRKKATEPLFTVPHRWHKFRDKNLPQTYTFMQVISCNDRSCIVNLTLYSTLCIGCPTSLSHSHYIFLSCSATNLAFSLATSQCCRDPTLCREQSTCLKSTTVLLMRTAQQLFLQWSRTVAAMTIRRSRSRVGDGMGGIANPLFGHQTLQFKHGHNRERDESNAYTN